MPHQRLSDDFDVQCPYCGALLTFTLDLTAVGPAFIEDCHVCCAPMTLQPEYDEAGHVTALWPRRDDE
ncbi:MAG: CPXCG motif-containing cysteine-rich protein [Thiotrichales bacterium]